MFVTTVVTFVLAAMLGPEAIGLVAMALVFVLFVEMLLQQGLMPAIVQRQELRREHADTAFWLVLGTGLFLTVTTILVAPLWALLNGIAGLAAVVWGLSALILIQSLVIVQEAILRREMRFRALAVRTVLAGIIGGIAGVACALWGLGVWSLVVQQLTAAVVGVAVLWRVSPWRPRLHFDKVASRELFSFSRRSALASAGVFVGNRADILISGLFFGPVVVGVYRLAQKAASTGADISSRAMQAVSLPELSAYQFDRTAFGRRYLRLQQLTAAVSLPVLGAIGGVSGLLGPALGEDWLLVGDPLRGLAFAAALTALTSVAGPALQALGSPGVLAAISWIRAALVAISLIAVGMLMRTSPDANRLDALVLVSVVSAAGSLIGLTIVVARRLELRWTSVLLSYVTGTAAGVVASATGWIASMLVPDLLPPVPAFLTSAGIAVALGAVTAIACLRPRLKAPRRSRLVVTAAG